MAEYMNYCQKTLIICVSFTILKELANKEMINKSITRKRPFNSKSIERQKY